MSRLPFKRSTERLPEGGLEPPGAPDAQRDREWTGPSYSAGLSFSLAGFVVIGTISLLTSILSARLYGITVIGQAALALAPVTIVTLLSTVREQPAMVRELAKLEPRHPRVTGVSLAVFLFSFTLTTVVTALGLVVCDFVFHGPLHNPRLLAPAAVALCGYLLVINTCWCIDGVLGAFRAGRELFTVRLHQAVVYGVLLVVFTFFDHSVWGLVLAFLGSWSTALVHRLLLLRRVIRWRVPLAEVRAGFHILREIIAFGLQLTPGFLSSGVSEASGTWILGATGTVDMVGAYSRAWNIASRLTELNWRITEMLLPTLVQRRTAGDTEGFNRVLVDSLRYASFGLLLPAAVGGGAADGVMHVFGAGFGSAATALRWLLLVPLMQTVISIQGAAMMASNRPLVTSWLGIVRLTITLIAGVGLTLAFGIVGMAIAMAAGVFVAFLAYTAIVRVVLRIPLLTLWGYREMAGLLAAYGAGFATADLIQSRLPGTPGLAAALLIGAFAYALVGIAVGGTIERDRDRLRSALRRVLPRGFALAERLELT
jgi:O-antigen/teichoic acid export membrane protein